MYGTGQDNLGFQTLLMYLNDDFDGGETSFRSYKSGEEDPIIQSIVPKTGSVLLFDHTQEHQGNIVRNGRKMVLRTEVVHKKILLEESQDPFRVDVWKLISLSSTTL
jgi:hypothetical protein